MEKGGAEHPNDGVVGHVPAKRRGSAAHAERARKEAHGTEGAATPGLDGAVAGEGQHGALEPRGEPPARQDESIPIPAHAFEGHGLVSKERSRGGVSGAGRDLGQLVLGSLAESAKELGPEGTGWSGWWGLRSKVLECSGDVGATVAALGGSLVRAELGLYLGSDDGGDVGAEEPAEAGGEL